MAPAGRDHIASRDCSSRAVRASGRERSTASSRRSTLLQRSRRCWAANSPAEADNQFPTCSRVGDATPRREAAGRIAVVIPFYRADRWFPEAFASVLTQTRPPDEIVVVDDATPASEARTLENLPDGVRLIRLARNAGVSTSRQIGTEATNADLVAYLDADDWWEPRHLGALEGMLTRRPEAPASYTGVVKLYPDGRQVPFTNKPAMLDVREAIVRSHVLPSGFMVRRAALEAIGGWRRDRMVVEDWDLSVRLLDRCGPMPLVPELLVNYRVGNPASI